MQKPMFVCCASSWVFFYTIHISPDTGVNNGVVSTLASAMPRFMFSSDGEFAGGKLLARRLHVGVWSRTGSTGKNRASRRQNKAGGEDSPRSLLPVGCMILNFQQGAEEHFSL